MLMSDLPGCRTWKTRSWSEVDPAEAGPLPLGTDPIRTEVQTSLHPQHGALPSQHFVAGVARDSVSASACSRAGPLKEKCQPSIRES